jgi:hypothetical protein
LGDWVGLVWVGLGRVLGYYGLGSNLAP